MKALFLVDDPVEKIKISEIDAPTPKPGEALIRLKAAALNHRDQWCREGKYPNIRFNCVLGSDGSGWVEEVGDEKDAKWIDREVVINPNINWGSSTKAQSLEYSILGMPDNGTFADYVVVDIDRLHEKPDHLSLVEAAAFPLAGLTAFRAVFTQGKVTSGNSVLISGVGGGVAQFAFLFAVAVNANVYVTSGSDKKIKSACSLGAKDGFNYKLDNWSREALDASKGFDVVIDSAGGDQINDFIKTLRPGGTIVSYGATHGLPTALDLYRLFWNQSSIQGSTMGSDEEFTKMMAFVKKHKIKPIIDSVRPFDEIVSAFDEMRSGKQFGKLIVEM